MVEIIYNIIQILLKISKFGANNIINFKYEIK